MPLLANGTALIIRGLRDSGGRVTGKQLQAEMDRMAKGTKDPATLKEVFAALHNDPILIGECLEPILADRLSRSWYANDERFHAEAK